MVKKLNGNVLDTYLEHTDVMRNKTIDTCDVTYSMYHI